MCIFESIPILVVCTLYTNLHPQSHKSDLEWPINYIQWIGNEPWNDFEMDPGIAWE